MENMFSVVNREEKSNIFTGGGRREIPQRHSQWQSASWERGRVVKKAF